MICQLLPTPKLVAPHVTRVYQSLARPYISLAEAFEGGDVQKMSAEINLGQSIWRAVRCNSPPRQLLY
jgi:COP9 signalosome complex subunit 3